MNDSPETGTPVAEENLLGGEETQDTAETPWYESLPEELKNEPTVQKYKTVEEAAKGLVNAVKMIGRDKVVVPKQDADPSEWESFFDAVGRPKTPDEYKVELENADGDFLKSFKDAAHRSGLNQQQVDGLLSFWNQATERAVEKMQTSRQVEVEQGVEALKKDWGTAFDREVAVAKRAVRSLCDEEQRELLNEGLGNDPRIVKLFNKLGKMMGEDTLKALPDSTTVVESAQAEITRLKGDASFIQKLNDKMSPGHREAVEQFRILHEKAFPTE
jgi:hypothetical protein